MLRESVWFLCPHMISIQKLTVCQTIAKANNLKRRVLLQHKYLSWVQLSLEGERHTYEYWIYKHWMINLAQHSTEVLL